MKMDKGGYDISFILFQISFSISNSCLSYRTHSSSSLHFFYLFVKFNSFYWSNTLQRPFEIFDHSFQLQIVLIIFKLIKNKFEFKEYFSQANAILTITATDLCINICNLIVLRGLLKSISINNDNNILKILHKCYYQINDNISCVIC